MTKRLIRTLSWERYKRCRRLFASPLRAHLTLSGAPKRPFELDFRKGGKLVFPRYRWVRPLWRFLFEDPERADSVHVEDGVLKFSYEGSVFGLRPDSYDFYVFTEIYLHDVYRLARLPRPLGTVVDLGANVGLFSTRAATLGAERVVALEPVSGNRKLAAMNLAGAGVSHRVRLLDLAAAGKSGETIRIFLSRENSGAHSCLLSQAEIQGVGGHEEVDSISLVDLFEREGIDHCALLKCDVEGAEFDILLNTTVETLGRVERIAVEFHLSRDLPATNLEALRSHLCEAGFRLEEEEGDSVEGLFRRGMLYGTRGAPA